MASNMAPLRMLDQLAALLSAQPGIVFASVFGSVAGGNARSDSDLDVAVLTERGLDAGLKRQLIARLASIAGRPVDLVDLADAGPAVTLAALRGKRLVGRGSAAHAALLARAWTDVADFLPLREQILQARRTAWIG